MPSPCLDYIIMILLPCRPSSLLARGWLQKQLYCTVHAFIIQCSETVMDSDSAESSYKRVNRIQRPVKNGLLLDFFWVATFLSSLPTRATRFICL